MKVLLLAFLRFVNDGEIQENFFCYKELPETSKAQGIFNSILETEGLLWENCVGICTDDAPSTVASIRGFTSLVKKENPDVVITHCFIHREVLVPKTLEMKW
jgi:hypothetical protein